MSNLSIEDELEIQSYIWTFIRFTESEKQELDWYIQLQYGNIIDFKDYDNIIMLDIDKIIKENIDFLNYDDHESYKLFCKYHEIFETLLNMEYLEIYKYINRYLKTNIHACSQEIQDFLQLNQLERKANEKFGIYMSQY